MDTRALLIEAAHREIAAFELYERLSKRIENPEGAETFAKLARDEVGHRERLAAWWTRKFGGTLPIDPKAVEPAKIKIDTKAGAVDALELALAREKDSAVLYESLAKGVSDEDLRALCRDLSEQEWGHFNLIRAEIAAVTGDFYWFDIDYAGHVEE
jgi:rubrerythrin